MRLVNEMMQEIMGATPPARVLRQGKRCPGRKPVVLGLAMAVWLGAAAPLWAATGDPLPGIDVLIKRKPSQKPTRAVFGTPDLPALPAGFFFSGSPAFSGDVFFEWVDPTNDNDAIDLDFVEGATPNVFDVELEPMTLTSVEPVDIGGGSFFDVTYELAADGLPPGEPVTGTIAIPPGETLAPNLSHPIVDMAFNVSYSIQFFETGTGNPVGSPVTGTTTLNAVDVENQVFRQDFGPVQIRNGTEPFTPVSFESPGGGHVLTVANVPEPASLVLLGLGMLGLGRRSKPSRA